MAGTSVKQSGGGGCLAVIAVCVVVALIVMAVISPAALIDPSDWMPTTHEIWDDCSDDRVLAHRFPGFWWHAAANLLYAGLAVAVDGGFLAAVRDARAKRLARFDSEADAAAFAAAHEEFVGRGTALAGLAALQMLVAIF